MVDVITLNRNPSVLPSTLPPVFGEGLNRRRSYTVDALPFDAFERAGRARPGTVPAGVLHVEYVAGPLAVTVRAGYLLSTHELDGAEYPTLPAAERALYEGGVLAFRVYEADAAQLGLAVGIQWAPHKTPHGAGCSWSLVSAPAWLAGDHPPIGLAYESITEDDRRCPADCPDSTVEPVTLDPADWAQCERCRVILPAFDINDECGLCDGCEAHNDARVSL